MDESLIKEELSISYISAICAYAGIIYETQHRDQDSTDGVMRRIINLDDGVRFNSIIRVQLKSTSSLSQYSETDNTIKYQLKVKNYNDLCTKSTSPILLLLLILPSEQSEWIKWTTEDLLINGRMYWKSFSNESPTSNLGHITIEINKDNQVNDKSILNLLELNAKEELL